MGKCETATASIGIKILLSDLILQINETNFELIKSMLNDGHIEDENDDFNEAYTNVMYSDALPSDWSEFKEYITHEFTVNGSYHKSRDGKSYPTLDNGCLLDKYILVPIKRILQTERWGHDRYGTNCISRPIDFDLSASLDEYKDITNAKVVFLLIQHSG